MTAFKEMLQTQLKKDFTKAELELLPNSYQMIGRIAIIKLKPEILSKKQKIAEAILELIHNAKTICLQTGEIKGGFREPQIEYISGEKNLETIHHEHGCEFKFDVSKIMWSKGNLNERKRMYSLIQKDEVVMDFFTGIGYWSIPIAKLSPAKKVISFELNPTALRYLKENVKLNKIPAEKIEIIQGNCSTEPEKLGRIANRVIMGYLPAPFFAVESALKCIKQNGIIHFEGTVTEGKENELFAQFQAIAEKNNYSAKLIQAVNVKNYGPKTCHYTLDIQIQS